MVIVARLVQSFAFLAILFSAERCPLYLATKTVTMEPMLWSLVLKGFKSFTGRVASVEVEIERGSSVVGLGSTGDVIVFYSLATAANNLRGLGRKRKH